LFVFDAEVDWHERHKILKFELPLNVRSDNATYETQFGHVQRPTHKNTTWDAAKFEVCGHKYADLSEFGYGVAILSESKYGYSCQGNVLRLSLLRAATAPDAEQDMGKHEFSWAVMPHQGHFMESDVPQAAYIFNSPMHMRYVPKSYLKAPIAERRPPFTLEGGRNVFLETVKRGESDDFSGKKYPDSIVLRLYEAFGGHGYVKLRISGHIPVWRATTTNLLEDEEVTVQCLPCDDEPDDPDEEARYLKLEFRAFEVKTIKLTLRERAHGAERAGPKREGWVTVESPK